MFGRLPAAANANVAEMKAIRSQVSVNVTSAGMNTVTTAVLASRRCTAMTAKICNNMP